jgi:hypothetical protein
MLVRIVLKILLVTEIHIYVVPDNKNILCQIIIQVLNICHRKYANKSLNFNFKVRSLISCICLRCNANYEDTKFQKEHFTTPDS